MTKPRTFGERTRRFRSWTTNSVGDSSASTPIAWLKKASCFALSISSTHWWASFSKACYLFAAALQQPSGGIRDCVKFVIEVGASDATEKNIPWYFRVSWLSKLAR